MTLKPKISLCISLIDTITKATCIIQTNHHSTKIPDLKLALLTFKAKFESIPLDSYSKINEKITLEYLDKINSYLQTLASDSQEWKSVLKESHSDNIQIFTSRLLTISEFFEAVIYFPIDDIFSLPKTHPRWVRLLENSEFHHTEKKQLIIKKHQKLFTKIASSLAYISKKKSKTHGKKDLVMIGIGSLFYMMQKKKALRKAYLLYSTPSFDTVNYIMNILETKSFQKLSKIVMKGVKYDKVIYLPRTVSHVLVNSVDLQENNKKFSIEPDYEKVMVRILSVVRFPSFENHKKLVIHIHGGGFISMSSASHQVYTNIWAQDLKVPIFSIDYRLAPGNPFPDALDDIWQVYNWLENFGNAQLGVWPEDYVIVGDSAGGNLALALAYKIIQAGLKPPKGIVLAYPALNLDKSNYSPSLLHALEDLLVPHTFLKLCLEGYLADWDNVAHPFVSPGMAGKDLMSKLPPIRIVVGTQDPLHDECWRFTEKLLDLEKDVKISVYEGTYHGGLNYSFKGGVKETRDIVQKMSNWMKEFLKLE